MTHGDEIRKSSDDELVELLVGIAMGVLGVYQMGGSDLSTQ